MNDHLPDNPHGDCDDDDGLVTAAHYGCDHCRSLRFADIASQLDKDDQAWLYGFLAHVCRLEGLLEDLDDDDDDDPLDHGPIIVDPDHLPDKPHSNHSERAPDEND